MSDRPRSPVRSRDAVVVIPRRILLGVVGAGTVVLLVFGIFTTGALTRLGTVATVAGASDIARMQNAAERDVERAYENAVDQVRKVRALRLAISAGQADVIATKALFDLRTLRHSAFVSLGTLAGQTAGDAERSATALEQRFDVQPVGTQPSSPAVLLAPRLYGIVARMSALATQLSDQAGADLTGPAVTGSPGPHPSVAPTPIAKP